MPRAILSTVAGVIVAFTLIMLIETAGHSLWPPPAGLDMSKPESLRLMMQQMPLGALLSVAVAWVVAAFVGGWVAAKFSERTPSAYVVGGLVALGAFANLLMIPHPFWFWLVALLLVPLAAYAAGRLGVRRELTTKSA